MKFLEMKRKFLTDWFRLIGIATTLAIGVVPLAVSGVSASSMGKKSNLNQLKNSDLTQEEIKSDTEFSPQAFLFETSRLLTSPRSSCPL
ncbi:MAG: hypothetical protein HC881_14870 [Leptolyngbyaceae cyanobacterium SL_7_1]|nr:hypothetical protein [Leptolyngbyaceae cyanobacterium SL_7_1]